MVTFLAVFGINGKPCLCAFRITLSFIKYVKIWYTNLAITEATPEIPVPNLCLDLIRHPKLGPDDCFTCAILLYT